MEAFLIDLLKRASEFIAHRKGLPVMIGALLILLNFILVLLPPWPVIGWLAHVNLFMHLGIIVGLLGILVGDAV